MDTILDWTQIPEGTRLGELTFGKSFRSGTRNRINYEITCSCGRKTTAPIQSIKKGKKRCKSCSLKDSCALITHKLSRTRLYVIYNGMKARCYNSRDIGFKNWGGRGIVMCQEWKNDFLVFYNWAIANGYQDNLSIDRINNDGNYEPSNCRWATMKEQCNNTRKTIRLTIDGVTKTVSEWAKESPVSAKIIIQRINRSFMNPKDAVFRNKIPQLERNIRGNQS